MSTVTLINAHNGPRITLDDAIRESLGSAPDYHAGELERMRARQDKLEELFIGLVTSLPVSVQPSFHLDALRTQRQGGMMVAPDDDLRAVDDLWLPAPGSCEHGMPLKFGCDDCTIARLDAQVKAQGELLRHITLLAHCGGLVAKSESEALNHIRRATLPIFHEVKGMSPAETAAALREGLAKS